MKALFDSLPKYTYQHVDYIIDTCFLFYMFNNNHVKEFIKFSQQYTLALTSFTVEEILHHRHDIGHHFKDHFRHALKNGLRILIIEVPVHPGDHQGERNYVQRFDPHILEIVADPSDAILVPVACEHNATILTRDKHHLFTTALENYLENKGVRVENNI